MRELLHGQLITHVARPANNDGDNWLPVVDGDFLPDAPSKLIAERRFANVSTIMGWTENDAMLFTPSDIKTSQQTYHFIRKYLPGFTEAHINQLLALYPVSDFATTYFPNGRVKLHAECYRTGRMFRDLLFTCQPILYG
jgi:carboxylesterase type B